jgi:hypothetical protein
VLAHKVAAEVAPEITALAKESFDGSQTPDGIPWAPGVDGQKVKLHKTGALEEQIHYVAVGTKLRVALGVSYARFQIGKRPVFPRQSGQLPANYIRAIERTAVRVVKQETGL